MGSDIFEKWFREQLLPNYPKNSVIIMHNAFYYSCDKKDFKYIFKKEEIKEWEKYKLSKALHLKETA